jgi:hypothetical protein
MAAASSSRCLGSSQRCVNCGPAPLSSSPFCIVVAALHHSPGLRDGVGHLLPFTVLNVLAVLAERRFERAYRCLRLLKLCLSKIQKDLGGNELYCSPNSLLRCPLPCSREACRFPLTLGEYACFLRQQPLVRSACTSCNTRTFELGRQSTAEGGTRFCEQAHP